MNIIDDRERGSAGQHQGAAMKKGWQTKKLGDVATLQRGFDLPTQERVDGDIPLVTSSGITDTVDKSAVHGPGVATGRSGSIGKVFYIDQDFWPLNTVLYVKDFHGNDPRFIFYLLRKFDLNRFATGTGVPTLNRNFVHDEIVNVPPLPEQQRIAALLDEAFAGLATAKANAERTHQNARAIFESHLQSVFSRRGEGWLETTIGETCTLKSGTTVSPALERPGGDVPYLKVADMSFEGNEDQITSSSRFLMRADIKESAVIPAGATIFPKRGGAIMTNKKRIAALPICADLNIMSVIPSQKISARLLYYYFLNVDMRKLGSGSSIPQINNYDVEPLEISFPESLATQEELIRAFDDLSAETQHLTRLYERKLAALEELKKSLLHQAFSGEL